MMYFLSLMFLGILIFVVFYFSSLKTSVSYINQSSFECGFVSTFHSRYSFSVHYVMIVLIFILLDLEFTLIFWFFFSSSSSLFYNGIVGFFLLFVLGSLLYEWYSGSFEWLY